ncbi:histone-lysine N-methyltransferase SETMAR [Trichonephila inaurata madagascariensis]|uniref:Histone-lysine N-methyltransferase SETMAR n=1 Tax=Trichonephila inaurata madagascariensis TaxID=2747483 RepID=A0A8X6XTA3_9ARAC|nr:histone-lysine N-methyltransferase SETMAR [Trichonephila inaurata madagascariensis]
MRVENHSHIRHIMLYNFEKGWKAAQSFRDLNELFGEGTISERQCREWFARFKSDDTCLEDKPGRGRPSEFDDQALLAAVEEDENLTTRTLAENFNVNQSAVVRCLKKLGKSLDGSPTSSPTTTEPIAFEFSPSYCRETNKHHFLKNLVTGEESWLLIKNVKRKKVCVSPGISPKGISKHVHCKKAI